MSFGGIKVLRIDLSNRKKQSVEVLGEEVFKKFMGGRGLASKIIWDELDKGIDPLGPANKLVIAGGPLSGLPIPSAGKLVIAAKSPHTLGYGDGNIGSRASVQLRKTGHDAVVFEGKADQPVWVHIGDDKVEFHDASGIWGKDAFQKEDFLYDKVGPAAGALLIGPGGENLVKYATIMSQRGRAGGRTGMGAVMGSKNLAAVTFRGSKEVRVHDKKKLSDLAKGAYQEIKESEDYNFWTRQGTMLAVRFCNLNSTLPTKNFSEGIFDQAQGIDGYCMEGIKKDRKGCPNCNMRCGNRIQDAEGKLVELDYENVAMLGSNLGIGELDKVGTLNRLCDEYGIDTISTGSCVAFAMEAAEKGIIDESLSFGDYEEAKKLTQNIALRFGLGDQLAEGVKRTAKEWGRESIDWAMQVKGLEISAYNCHSLPGMALAFGTSPIGAHHKDCWVIAWEIENERSTYSNKKIDQILNHQRKRGGAFECFTTCRLPWIEVGFNLEWYEKFFESATGFSMTWKDFDQLGDRIYALIRAIWVREYGDRWSAEMDVPPERWFTDPLPSGDFEGATLDKDSYMDMLSRYYRKRGWNRRGIPTEATLKDLNLDGVAEKLYPTC